MSHMDILEAALRSTNDIPSTYRLDIVYNDGGGFVATVVSPNLDVVATYSGMAGETGNGKYTVSMSEDPVLTFVEARVYDRVWGDFSAKLEAALQVQADECVLMHEGDHTDLFPTLSSGGSVNGCASSGKLFNVWWAINNQFQQRSLTVLLYPAGNHPASLRIPLKPIKEDADYLS